MKFFCFKIKYFYLTLRKKLKDFNIIFLNIFRNFYLKL